MASGGDEQQDDRAAAQEHRRLTEPGRTRGGGPTSAGQRLAGTRAVRERLAAVERTTWGRQG